MSHGRISGAGRTHPAPPLHRCHWRAPHMSKHITLPYERLNETALAEAVRLHDGEHLLVLQPFGWHLDAEHISNMPEQFS